MPPEIQVFDGTVVGEVEGRKQQINQRFKDDFIALVRDLMEVAPTETAALKENIRDVIDYLDGRIPMEGTGTAFFLLGQAAGEAYIRGRLDLVERCSGMGRIFNERAR